MAALGESPALEEEGVVVAHEGTDRRPAVPVPLELQAVDWLAPCCDDMPCVHQDHAWRDMICTL